jgi:hypothetical protein
MHCVEYKKSHQLLYGMGVLFKYRDAVTDI